jgi:hypothetical protein
MEGRSHGANDEATPDTAERQLGARLDRSVFEIVVDDDFDEPELDGGLWLPWYLPQWSSRAATAARFEIRDSCLRLRIDRDQRPWSEEFDGLTKVSSLQTAVSSGPAGSTVGQLHFRDGLVVREAQPTIRRCTPTEGLVEARLRAIADPACMVALWMIGIEDEPAHSGEICIAEIFGRDVGDDRAAIGMGIHPFADPRLRDEFEQIEVALDAREFHVYSAEWTADAVDFYVDDRLVKVTRQSPRYPMQVMLGIYEFADGDARPARDAAYPKALVVDWFRILRRRR